MRLRLLQKHPDVHGVVAEVSDVVDVVGELAAQVGEVLRSCFVVGVVHQDGAGVDQLRGQGLDLIKKWKCLKTMIRISNF